HAGESKDNPVEVAAPRLYKGIDVLFEEKCVDFFGIGICISSPPERTVIFVGVTASVRAGGIVAYDTSERFNCSFW
ncbi:MAG: hypothetical protein JWQ40_4795, partial [Segetibacter sp.]|nr:hypothetical protein [Segetibacter sp.]